MGFEPSRTNVPYIEVSGKTGNFQGSVTTVGAVNGTLLGPITIESNTVHQITIMAVGTKSNGDFASRMVCSHVSCISGTAAVAGATTYSTVNSAALAGFAVGTTVSGATYDVVVTGVAGETINWRAAICISKS